VLELGRNQVRNEPRSAISGMISVLRAVAARRRGLSYSKSGNVARSAPVAMEYLDSTHVDRLSQTLIPICLPRPADRHQVGQASYLTSSIVGMLSLEILAVHAFPGQVKMQESGKDGKVYGRLTTREGAGLMEFYDSKGKGSGQSRQGATDIRRCSPTECGGHAPPSPPSHEPGRLAPGTASG
jgi:hypothetical protein